MHVVLLLERLVPVLIAHALAHRIRAVEKLHKAHTAFDQPSRQHAVAREAGLELVRIVHASDPGPVRFPKHFIPFDTERFGDSCCRKLPQQSSR